MPGDPAHHTRPPIEMEGGTTFHFIDTSPDEALATAREAAGGQDVRLWDGLEDLQKDDKVETTSSASGVTHVTVIRAGV